MRRAKRNRPYKQPHEYCSAALMEFSGAQENIALR